MRREKNEQKEALQPVPRKKKNRDVISTFPLSFHTFQLLLSGSVDE
jgi:hypothetical protein